MPAKPNTVITKIKGLCEFGDCTKKATHVAEDRSATADPGLGLFCEQHAHIVADRTAPEYHVSCPNCGCVFGVN